MTTPFVRARRLPHSPGPPVLLSVGRILIETSCIWELVALHVARVPTISQTVHRYRRRPSVRAALILLGLWLSYHLVLEEAELIVPVPVVE